MSETPPRKRYRISQACDRCRLKKYKCESRGSRCEACATADAECSRNNAAKRRGLQPGYVKALETLWSLLFREVAGSEHTTQRLLGQLADAMTDHSSDRDRHADPLLQSWRGSGVPHAIECILDGEPWEVPTNSSDGVFEFGAIDGCVSGNGLGSDMPSLRPPPSPPPTVPSPPAPRDAAVARNVGYTLAVPTEPTLPPLPADWYQLVHSYLTTEQTWLPILERKTLFRSASLYQDRSERCTTGLDDQTKAEIACLWAVLTLGEIHSQGAASSRIPAFQQTSRSLLRGDEISAAHATYAQVLLLWSVVNLGRSQLLQARMDLAHAIVLATTKHQLSSSTNQADESQRNLVLCCCLVLDVLVSLAAGSKPLMRPDDLPPAVLPCDETAPDEWEPCAPVNGMKPPTMAATSASVQALPSRSCSTFNQLFQLCRSFSEVLHFDSPPTVYANSQGYEGVGELGQFDGSIRNRPGPPLLKQSPPQIHLTIVRLAYDAVSKARPSGIEHGSHLDNICAIPTGNEIAKLLLHIAHWYGAQALPASCGSLLVAVATSPQTVSDMSAIGAICATYQETWQGPGITPSVAGNLHDDEVANEDTHLASVPPMLNDPLNPTALASDARGAMSLSPLFGDATFGGTAEADGDPLQEYMALIDGNQHTGSNDFLLSLGFLNEANFASAGP